MSVIKKRYTKSEKMAIVLESQEEGMVIEDLAHRYAVHENTIRRWRKEYSAYNTAAFPGKGNEICLLYTSPSPRDGLLSRMPSSA